MAFVRHPNNPLLSPSDVNPTRGDLEILCTFNPGAVRFGGEILLLVRVAEKPVATDDNELATCFFDPARGELVVLRINKKDPDLVYDDPRVFTYKKQGYLTSVSHLRLARSRDGGKTFTFDDAPAMAPDCPDEMFGLEDARITLVEGRYYINYSAISTRGVATRLAVTDDFKTFTKLGTMFTTNNKDIAIFPERVRGQFVCRHRPDGGMFNKPSIWTAWSPDMIHWGQHEMTLTCTPGTWEGSRIGCGAPPIKTPEGWLEIYHAADANGRYCLGSMLSDLDRPEKVICRSSRPVLEPTTDYETIGLYKNAIFSNGLVVDDDGVMTVYYGAADRVVAAASCKLTDMIAAAKR
ncbi:MAG: glycoside hydrolase family 130 protein [Phycisphaerae bacterium]|nr:glycoside hydrolase family 130 protein [Phycisphaerae bacterium]